MFAIRRGSTFCVFMFIDEREQRNPTRNLMAQLGIKHTDCTFKLLLYETETIMSDSSWCGSLCWAFLAAVQPVVLTGPTANNIDDGLAEYTGLLPFPGAGWVHRSATFPGGWLSTQVCYLSRGLAEYTGLLPFPGAGWVHRSATFPGGWLSTQVCYLSRGLAEYTGLLPFPGAGWVHRSATFPGGWLSTQVCYLSRGLAEYTGLLLPGMGSRVVMYRYLFRLSK